MTPPPRTLTARLARLLRPHCGKLCAAAVLSLLASGGLLMVPLVVKNILHAAIVREPFAASAATASLVALALVCLFAAAYGAVLLMFDIAHGVSAQLRVQYVSRLVTAPLESHRDRQAGELIDRLTTSVNDIESFIKEAMLGLPTVVLVLCGTTTMLLALSWKLALLLLVTVPIGSILLRWLLDHAREALGEAQGAAATLAGHVVEILGAIEVVKAFNAEQLEVDRYRRQQERLVSVQNRGARFVALLEPAMLCAAVGVLVLVLVSGSSLLSSGELQVDALIAFLMYTLLLIPQTRLLRLQLLGWQQCRHSLARLDEVITLPGEHDGAVALLSDLQGRIELRHVTYAYPGRPPALNDLSLTVGAKECIGIVGGSGAGKTTLFNLLLRFYRPQRGSIRIDGVDIQDVSPAGIREAIAVVPQDIMLFDDTILENVRYGRPAATDEEVRAACRVAQAESFILALPRQYETVVGGRGLKLAGGQRQRLAIARALLKDAPILLLDEASSSLDSPTERQLRDAIAAAMRGRTTLIIAHRLATVMQLPRIIVLREGRAVDGGSHEELLSRCEHYRELVSTQLMGTSPEAAEPVTA